MRFENDNGALVCYHQGEMLRNKAVINFAGIIGGSEYFLNVKFESNQGKKSLAWDSISRRVWI